MESEFLGMGLPLSTDFSKVAPGSSKRQPALSTGAGENSDPFERIPGFKPHFYSLAI